MPAGLSVCVGFCCLAGDPQNKFADFRERLGGKLNPRTNSESDFKNVYIHLLMNMT